MSTITKEFTKEQLKQIIETDHVQCGEASALARIALASLEAVPVGEVSEQRDGLVMDGMVDLGGASTHRIIKGASKMKRLPLGTKFYTAPPAPVSVPDEDLLHMAASAIDDLLSNKDRSGAGVWADIPAKLRRAAMLQGAEHNRPDAVDANLVEALRLVQCMLEDYRERNYGDAERWIRHIDTHMSDYSETHGDDAYSILHDLLPAAPQREDL